MVMKPIVIYAEKDNDSISYTNPDREALIYFLEKECGVLVKIFNHPTDVIEEFGQLKKYFDAKQVALVIIKQLETYDQYPEINHEHTELVEYIRTRVSINIPVVMLWHDIFRKGAEEKMYDEKVFCCFHTDPELVSYIKKTLSICRPSRGWLGAETIAEQSIISRQLQEAYHFNYLKNDDEKMLGTPDFNHQLVAEALRIKLLPTELIKIEFDDTLTISTPSFTAVTNDEYEKAIKKCYKLSATEKNSLVIALRKEEGWERDEQGGETLIHTGCTAKVTAFAIDPVTMEYTTIHGAGTHSLMAIQKLARKIESIEALLKRKSRYEFTLEESGECKQRILGGLIFSDICDWLKIPLIQFSMIDECPPKDFSKVIRFIKKEKMFIPIDHKGNVIEG